MTILTVERIDLAPPDRGAGFVAATLAVGRRTILKFLRTPAIIVLGTIQGAMFLLIFRYVFGGAVTVHGLSYVDFLVPGFVTTGVLFAGMAGATGTAEDVESGLFDRFRSLPMPRAACPSVSARVAFTMTVTGWWLATGRIQLGMVCTGT